MSIETPMPALPAPVDGPAVLCPLCEYDLRGLTQPRCPECGYRFVWAELLDRKRTVHPYLFEHHPESNIWSFIRTAIGGLNPVRFWRTLRPQMMPKAGRLIEYWITCNAIPILAVTGLLAAGEKVQQIYPTVNRQALFIWTRQYWTGHKNLMPIVAPPALPLGSQTLYDISLYAPGMLVASVLICSWAIINYLTLLIFQQSMSKGNILAIHVRRCVAYSFDMTSWVLFVALVPLVQLFNLSRRPNDHLLYWAIAVVTVPAIVRMWAAYRLYLGFDHAFWVVLSSQMITGLAIATVLYNLGLIR